MSTHCAVIQKTDKGYKAIYVHFDGYPTGAGEVLRQYYTDENKVSELINCGFLPSVQPTVKLTLKHKISYNESEFDKPAVMGRSIKEIDEKLGRGCADWLYLFNKGKWKVKKNY